MSRWKKHGKWGSWVEAKMNAPDLVKDKYITGMIFMSSVSDSYQPVEKELKLTRQILQNLDKRTRLSILTKSDLVLRDLDVLKEFQDVEVGLTINSFGRANKDLFEPNSPSNSKRIEALKKLHENGIKTYVFVSPLIPNLIDVEDLIRQTKDFTDYYWFEALNLRGAGLEFSEMLKQKYPESYRTLKDEKLFNQFINDIKSLCESSKISVRSFEKH